MFSSVVTLHYIVILIFILFLVFCLFYLDKIIYNWVVLFKYFKYICFNTCHKIFISYIFE